MKRTTYDNGVSFAVPESSIEIDLIRQVILLDKWDVVSETELDLVSRFSRLTWTKGGQAIFDPQWSAQFIVHYSVGEHLEAGRFRTTLDLYGKARANQVGTMHLLAALPFANVPHDFQCPLREMNRTQFFRPWWYLKSDQASSTGLVPRIPEGAGPLSTFPSRFTYIQPTHAVLIDPETVKES